MCLVTTTPRIQASAKPYRREQFIAALLVGAVVVLLGFASGLGTKVSQSAAGVAIPSPAPSTQTTSSQAAPSSPSAPTPIHYIGVPEPGVTEIASGTVPGTLPLRVTGSAAPRSTGSTGVARSRSRATVPLATGTSTTAPTSCSSNVLSSLLNLLSVSSLLGGGSTSLLSGRGGALPLTDVLALAFGSLGKTGSGAVPTLSLSTLTDLVSHLLPGLEGVGGVTTAPAGSAMITACTTSLASLVPILVGAG